MIIFNILALANLTVIMSAHVFTRVSLPELGATYRIYNDKILVFEKTELMQRLEFPFIVPKTMIPISTRENLTIEATIFGPVPALGFDKTLFEGVTHVLLVPGTNNNIKISMLYTGKQNFIISHKLSKISANDRDYFIIKSQHTMILELFCK
jgi:hypothetical protein